jgi:hypothetical protein
MERTSNKARKGEEETHNMEQRLREIRRGYKGLLLFGSFFPRRRVRTLIMR